MAYKMTKRGSLDNEITYEFFCDSKTDMEAIENNYRTLGSIAIVLEGESGGLEIYITNSAREWIPLNINAASTSENNNSGGGGSSGGGDAFVVDLAYDDASNAYTANKTAKQIYDAAAEGFVCLRNHYGADGQSSDEGYKFFELKEIYADNNIYNIEAVVDGVDIWVVDLEANDYPVFTLT